MEYAACPRCRRIVAAYVPSGGDGSIRLLRKHRPCGSRAAVEAWYETRAEAEDDMAPNEQVHYRILEGRHRFRGYPRHYCLHTTLGHGLFAEGGEHRGAGMGTLYHYSPRTRTGEGVLYGSANFARHGGLAWEHKQHHRRFVIAGGKVRFAQQQGATNGH